MANFTVVGTPTHANGSGNSSQTIAASTIGNIGLFATSADHSSPTTFVQSGGATEPFSKIGSTMVDAVNGQEATIWMRKYTASINGLAFSNMIAYGLVYVEFNSDVGWAGTPLDVSDTAKAFFSSSTTANANASNNITIATGASVGSTITINKSGDSITVAIAALKASDGDELIISCAFDQTGTAPIWTAGTGYAIATQEPGSNGATGSAVLQWKKVSASVVTPLPTVYVPNVAAVNRASRW